MPKVILRSIVATACVAAGVGCGTLVNFREENDPKVQSAVPPGSVYGGVRVDATQLSYLPGDCDSAASILENGLLTLFLVADIPLSAAADTLTLPATLSRSLRSGKAEPPAHEPASPADGSP